jgi:hypothetical protein
MGLCETRPRYLGRFDRNGRALFPRVASTAAGSSSRRLAGTAAGFGVIRSFRASVLVLTPTVVGCCLVAVLAGSNGHTALCVGAGSAALGVATGLIRLLLVGGSDPGDTPRDQATIPYLLRSRRRHRDSSKR